MKVQALRSFSLGGAVDLYVGHIYDVDAAAAAGPIARGKLKEWTKEDEKADPGGKKAIAAEANRRAAARKALGLPPKPEVPKAAEHKAPETSEPAVDPAAVTSRDPEATRTR